MRAISDQFATRRPTRWTHAVFLFKVRVHQARRGVADAVAGPRQLSAASPESYPLVLGRSSTPLISDRRPEERVFQLGKIENLRQAGRRLDGLGIPAGGVLSFWRQVGPPVPGRGFVVGRMLQEGCVVPAVGGGLCQLSNALFDVALQAGCEVIERHAHSQPIAGSAAAFGRDATVAWNYVDLRVRARRALRLSVEVGEDRLDVSAQGRQRDGPKGPATPLPEAGLADSRFAESCATCGDVACFRHEPAFGPQAINGEPMTDPGAMRR